MMQKDAVRTVYEYVKHFNKEAIRKNSGGLEGLSGPDWDPYRSDDVGRCCMAISGIPSMVSRFADGSFMETTITLSLIVKLLS